MFNKKQNQRVLGDALDILESLPDAIFDACICDPPYNMSKKRGLNWAFSRHVTMQEQWDRFAQDDYLEFCTKWIREVLRVVKPNGNLLFFGSYHNIYQLGFLLKQMDRKILNSIIWAKPNAQPNITCRMLTESTEQILWACNETEKKAKKWVFDYQRAKSINNGKQLRNFWSFPVTPRSERVAGHPTQKPLALFERLILLFTNPQDWVLDPFSGVATTAIAAKKHNRYYFLIEKDARYYKAQSQRLSAPCITSG